ncbi:hypothetical protein [Streptomyces sp. WM6378]|uniref:hypothetical protein n=1 Tax=Streptomyces sp. WM6378 TaxID=1415557 RepID=UPI00131C40F7|nr:hypothetical protein [Streptomyces sp. WM6378]
MLAATDWCEVMRENPQISGRIPYLSPSGNRCCSDTVNRSVRTKPVKIFLGCVALLCALGTAIALGGVLTGSGGGKKSAANASTATDPAVKDPADDASSDNPPAGSLVLRIDGPDGLVTPSEIKSFKADVETLTPAGDNIGNNWAQGRSGQAAEAMGTVYEISHDTAILDRMIGFCDAVLSERNDLAPSPVGRHPLWTGKVDPAWPNDVTAQPIGTGGEQGDPVGHLGNCARQILQTPAIWHKRVPIGDPHQYGATYLDRAKKFVAEADVAVDQHILARLLDVSRSDRQYFAGDSPYQGGKPVPWNQQMMFDYGFSNLASAHQILGDDAQRAARYDRLVKASVNWFFSAARRYTDPAGKSAYDWGYSPSQRAGEDSNHGSLDCAGLYRLYLTGRYSITASMMAPLANTLVDVMTKSPHKYAGRVDGSDGRGHGSSTSYLRGGFLPLAEFRPDAYHAMLTEALPGNGTTSIDSFSGALMLKSRRGQHHY